MARNRKAAKDAMSARIAELEAENARWRQNMREAYEAFTAMRNDLNELFPIQSAEADLLTGPQWSVSCAAIVKGAEASLSRTGAVKVSDIIHQIALWSDDEGFELSMGQGEDLARRIRSALSPSAPEGEKGESDRIPIAATDNREVDYVDVTGWGVFKGHAIPVAVARFIAEKINLYHAHRAHPAPQAVTEAMARFERIADIIRRNLFHQQEKISDARQIALDGAAALKAALEADR